MKEIVIVVALLILCAGSLVALEMRGPTPANAVEAECEPTGLVLVKGEQALRMYYCNGGNGGVE